LACTFLELKCCPVREGNAVAEVMAQMRGRPTERITGIEIMAMISTTTSIAIKKMTLVATVLGVTVGIGMVGISIGRERLEPA